MTEKEFIDKLDKCFISRRRKNDMAIKDSVYRNIKQVEYYDMENIHKRIISLMKIKSRKDSCYFDEATFLALLQEAGAVIIDDNTLNEFNIIT